jgi:hypothetical protein
MPEKMVIVDGKPIEESKMPKHCFMIQGQWYTENGLPKELEGYRRLWDEAKQSKQLGITAEQAKENVKKKNTAPPVPPSDPSNTAPTANTTSE